MQKYTKLFSSRMWVPGLIFLALIGGTIFYFVAKHSSNAKFTASSGNVASVLRDYTALSGFKMSKKIDPQGTCRESSRVLSLNRHFTCTMNAGAVLTVSTAADVSEIKSQITNVLISQRANLEIYEGGATTDSLESDLMQNKFWSEGFSLGQPHISVNFYLAAPNYRKQLGHSNLGGAADIPVTEQILNLWPSQQRSDEYILFVSIEDLSYDSCTSFFLPVCSVYLADSEQS